MDGCFCSAAMDACKKYKCAARMAAFQAGTDARKK
jgi:hypothetical protein